MNELPAFRVIYEDGESYVTSMAAGTTLDDARAYFIGERHTRADETKTPPVVQVRELYKDFEISVLKDQSIYISGLSKFTTSIKSAKEMIDNLI